jgi:hypothetical protein
MAIYGLEVPFGLLEPHYILLVLFRVCILFSLPLVGRHAISVLLLQLLTVLLHKLLDLVTLLSIVARGVVHWTTPLPPHHRCQMLDGSACHLRVLGPHLPR